MRTDPAGLYEAATALLAAGRLAEAETALRELLAAHPDEPHVQHALSHALLGQGRYAEGWGFYEARHRMVAGGWPKPQLPLPEWRGEPVAGKRLLVWPEQGFGDQIMHARFAAWAARQGAAVTLLAPPELYRLFQSLTGVHVVEAAGRVDFKADVWVMLGSMAGRGGFTTGDLCSAPYLAAEPRRMAARIGVMAGSASGHPSVARKSLDEASAARLLGLPGALDLRPEATGARDFAETAEIIAGLDVVISIDTSVAHLAGALGKPVRVLLFAPNPDWRWGPAGETTPWYPTARLCRQQAPGDWSAAVEQAITGL